MPLIILNREWVTYWFVLKTWSRVLGLSVTVFTSGIPAGLDVPGRLLGSAGPESVSVRHRDASQERTRPQGGKRQADKFEPVMKPQSSHGKDNSEHSVMLPFGFCLLRDSDLSPREGRAANRNWKSYFH